jgi:large subunit ribosomal protein L11
MIPKLKTVVKISLPAGNATINPPVGPTLGQHGININTFCKEFNEKTLSHYTGTIPILVFIYDDRSYSFKIKSLPTSFLLFSKVGLKKGASNPLNSFIGFMTLKDLEDIVRIKMPDLNTTDTEKAKKIITGTATSVGIAVRNKN